MKKCPYCAEEIQDEAIKCKHCGEMLSQPTPGTAPWLPWWDRNKYPPLTVLGCLVLVAGIAGLIYYGAFFNTGTSGQTVVILGQAFSGRIENGDLIHQRQNGLLICGIVAAAGLACAYLGMRCRVRTH